jgi:hypothetical protein
VEFSNNKDVKKAQRHILAAAVSLKAKSITPDEYESIMEFINHVTVVLKQQVREHKAKPKVKYFD